LPIKLVEEDAWCAVIWVTRQLVKNQATGRQNFQLGLGSVLDFEIVFFAQYTVAQSECRPDDWRPEAQ